MFYDNFFTTISSIPNEEYWSNISGITCWNDLFQISCENYRDEEGEDGYYHYIDQTGNNTEPRKQYNHSQVNSKNQVPIP